MRTALAFAAAALASAELPLIMDYETWRREFEGVRSFTPTGSAESREAQFKANIEKIKAHNELYDAGEVGYYMGVTQFTDLTAEEFVAAAGILRTAPEPPSQAKEPKVLSEVGVSSSIDWRSKGGVTPVKDQGQCGSCWSFSSTGAMEGNLFAETGTLLSLSEMELVDCDSQSFGCEGGLMQFAFEFVVKNGGIDTEQDWPYSPAAGTCNIAKERSSKAATFTGHEFVTVNNAQQLMAAVEKFPISVSLSADADIFTNYRGGVIDNPGCHTLGTHAVLAVGYTEANAESLGNAWIVKNSWGATWGDRGYFYISRSQAAHPEGICGILNAPVYPVGGRLTRTESEERLLSAERVAA